MEESSAMQTNKSTIKDLGTNGAALKTNILVKKSDNSLQALSIDKLWQTITWASAEYADQINVENIIQETLKTVYDGITGKEITDTLIFATISFIEHDPAYGYVASRLLFKKLMKEVTGMSVLRSDVDHEYVRSFINSIHIGVQDGTLDPRLLEFNLEQLALNLVPERDHLFDYMGLRTLYERYFVRHEERRIELPQVFWMRVAMGLALLEEDRNTRAVEFYSMMSLFRYIPSTPTLLHSGLIRPQLSSCFLTTVMDDLKHIFKSIGDNAQMSKWSGGLANDWTYVRATGAYIKSIKTESQGVIPYLKIANDTTAAINRSGKRRSAAVVYLETWHYDIEDFLDLRRNTGDERRRTHDINTANWVPDLFMKRVEQDGVWTLFSPEEVPDLHDLYGKAFEIRYEFYERQAAEGKIKLFKSMPAIQLWRKMLSRLFETGHPWITFKDASNIRSPQDHVGVVHSSNLCTEITLNTSADETAVCNLGSVNLTVHTVNGVLDKQMLAHTISTAMRMLDNVIDINFYPVVEAQRANLRHRPVGLGVMGFQDMLFKMNVPFSSSRTIELADETMEFISYHAISASSELAKERGSYASYKGSKWDRGIFPVDTLGLLEQERGRTIPVSRSAKLDWTPVREKVKMWGMRNSNTMAIAPTATISNIIGCFPCIEPIYKNIYVKANMSGEFTVINKYLVQDLKELNLWNGRMLELLKYYDGNLSLIPGIPQELKDKYAEAFDIDSLFLLEVTAHRGKWIDQSQSHNVFMKGTSGKMLNDIYLTAWKLGLKTTYYLRTLGATQIEKATLGTEYGFTQKREYKVTIEEKETIVEEQKACSISQDPDCEVCQ